VPDIRRIECGRAAMEIVGYRVAFRRQVGRGRVAQDRMLVEGIRCPEGGMCWCVVVYQPLHQGEVERWWWSGPRAGDAVGEGKGEGSKSEGLGGVGVGGCGVIGGGGFGACSSGRSVSIGVLTGVSSTVLSGAVDVVGLVGGGEGGSEWGGGEEGGIVVGIGICGIGAGEC